MTTKNLWSRRKFIYSLSANAGLVLLASQGISCQDTEKKEENKEEKVDEQKQQEKKLGIALVGLGKYAEGQLAPALEETKHCFLAGIVTGTPDKVDKWKRKYSIPDKNVYNYQNFDTIKDNPDIDIVYVVLPNSMHMEYVVRAAKAGKHVICEKPMALTVEECDKMIAACNEAGKKLSIGYRLHFEPHNKELMRLSKEKTFGKVQKVTAKDGMGKVEGWRLDPKLSGGGPLMDVGIYCVQGARYTTGMEPIAVTAKQGIKTKPDMFKGMEESLTWVLEFPEGVTAGCATSYVEDMNLLRMEAEKGWAELSPAYGYSGIEGKTSNGKMDLPKVNQQAFQMDDFALSIKDNRPSPVPGEMGRQDVKIITAIYEAMNSGKRIEIK